MTDATEPTVVTQALKPCPFCGGNAAMFWCDGFPQVRCNDCASATGMFITNSEADAITAWNTRAAEQSRASTPAVGRVLAFDLEAIDAVIFEMIGVAVNDGEGDAEEVDFDRGDVDRWQAILQIATGHKNGFPSRTMSPPASDDAIAAKDAEIARLREAKKRVVEDWERENPLPPLPYGCEHMAKYLSPRADWYAAKAAFLRTLAEGQP